MNRRSIGFSLLSLCLTAASWFATAPAQAMTVSVVYPLDYVFSPPTGTGLPLATVTITDLGNAVQFDVLNRAGPEQGSIRSISTSRRARSTRTS